MMQIFNAVVRLDGNVIHEVAKRGLTVPEIYILKRLHGDDGVVKIEHVGYADIDPADERERLDFEYGAGLINLHEDRKTSVEKMFGADYAPLVEELREYEGELVDREDTLAEFQKSEPFASPNAEDKGSQIRRKAAAKAAKKKENLKNIPTVNKSKTGKAALDAVL